MVFCGVAAGGTDGEDSEESLIADGVEFDDADVFFFLEGMLDSSGVETVNGKRQYHRFCQIFRRSHRSHGFNG